MKSKTIKNPFGIATIQNNENTNQ